MNLCKLFRNFARQQIIKPKPVILKNIQFDDLLKDKVFLNSIGVNVFPLSNEANWTNKVEVYDEDGKFIGQKQISEAKSFANKLNLDLILMEENPPVLQLADFPKFVLKKIRIAQNQLARRSYKENARTIAIKNNITYNDLNGKLVKITHLMNEFWKIAIRVELIEESNIELDKSKIFAMSIKKMLESQNK